MQQLIFTTYVLGAKAASRLEKWQITQTIRSESSSIVKAILAGGLKVRNMMQVVLGDRVIGLAEYIGMDSIYWEYINLDDTKRGGFDSLADLEQAVKRAGYRLRAVIYRIRFSWVKEKDYAVTLEQDDRENKKEVRAYFTRLAKQPGRR